MDLPSNIEEQVIAYLNLEFGTNDFKTTDLVFESSNSNHVWSFKSNNCKFWAIVEPYEGSYLISMSDTNPN